MDLSVRRTCAREVSVIVVDEDDLRPEFGLFRESVVFCFEQLCMFDSIVRSSKTRMTLPTKSVYVRVDG